MKFLSLALIGTTAAVTLQEAKTVVNAWDSNKDGCLEFNEFWAFIKTRPQFKNMDKTPHFRKLMHYGFNRHAGPDHCITPQELSK